MYRKKDIYREINERIARGNRCFYSISKWLKSNNYYQESQKLCPIQVTWDQ